MKTLVRLINGKEVSRTIGYDNLQKATNAGNSWLRDCTVHSEIRKFRSVNIIETI